MKKILLILAIMNNICFSEILEKDIKNVKVLRESDFYGSWIFFSIEKEKNFLNIEKIELHFNKSYTLNIIGTNIIKRYFVFNKNIIIGTKSTNTNLGIEEEEKYKILKKYNINNNECFIMEGISSIYKTEKFNAIMCKKK